MVPEWGSGDLYNGVPERDEIRKALGRLVTHGAEKYWISDVAGPLLELEVVQRRLDELPDGAPVEEALVDVLREAAEALIPSQKVIAEVVLALNPQYLGTTVRERRTIAGQQFRDGHRSVSWGTIRQYHERIMLDDLAAAIAAREVDALTETGALPSGPRSKAAAEPEGLARFATASAQRVARAEPKADRSETGEPVDLFISHAHEDKETVVRPLVEGLTALGWRVWLDELELMVGDSLEGQINAALARSRYGVVVLSPAFFARAWPQRELAALAAREVVGGSKVVLPIWHDVDVAFLLEHAPVLADRLAVRTSVGMPEVVAQISRAFEVAGARPRGNPGNADASSVDQTIGDVPLTEEDQRTLLRARPNGWEYLLFVGALRQGIDALGRKWHDHELHLPRGERRDVDDEDVPAFLGRELGWLSRLVETSMRMFDPDAQQAAFGAPGEPGDPVRILHFAERIVSMCEELLDWAASIHCVVVSDAFEDVVDILPRMVDQPVREIRDFVNQLYETMSNLSELIATAGEEGNVTIEQSLVLTVDESLVDELTSALRRASEQRG
jgi:hypothetical protein